AKANQENYPDSFMAVRFEDLADNTITTMKNISNFLNVDFEEGMLSPDISGKSYKGNNFEGRLFSGISSHNIGQWKTRITVESAKVIEYWMSDVMDYWGYNLEFDQMCSQIEFSKFYEKYNCKYFYHDSFECK
ncbi:sulfotransferase domain-containing protein, partial [Candidatus Thioglobus sp.]|nr:sulfotransferase domain-containing protein [Candidatus Thioglobus sp.]